MMLSPGGDFGPLYENCFSEQISPPTNHTTVTKRYRDPLSSFQCGVVVNEQTVSQARDLYGDLKEVGKLSLCKKYLFLY